MKKRLRYVTAFSLCLAFIFTLSAAYLEVIFPQNPFNLGTLGVIILQIVKGIGIALFTSTFVNWLKYWVESAEALVNYGFVERLTKDEMKGLKKEIETALYFKSNNHDIKDNFFNFFERELSCLLNKPYYKSYNAIINCRIGDKYICKTTRKTIEVVNPSQKCVSVQIPFSVELQKIENMTKEELYKIKKFSVDGNDFKDEIQKLLVPIDNSKVSTDAYCIKFDASWTVNVTGQCKIEMEVDTIVPLDDVSFSNKITYPCKLYSTIFTIDNPNYSLSWHSFGLSGNHKDKIIEEIMYNGIHLGFKDWILPGDGIVITINNAFKNNT